MPNVVSFGPYSVLGVLGGGNYATVYRARMPHCRDDVALKVLAPEHAGDARELTRFRAEYRLLARLRHPGIPRLLAVDDGTDTGRPFFVMTLAPGTSLRRRIEATGGQGLSLDKTIAILRSLADVVDYLHGEGVVHQDIKGENVIVDSFGGACRATLVDFGIAYGSHLAGLGLTNSGYGTVVHAAPEQAAGDVTGAADRYALGVLTYHMLAGRLPGVGVTRSLPPLAAVRPGLPEGVYSAVSRALDPKPRLRHPTARAFVKLLAMAEAKASPVPVPQHATPSPLSSGSGMVQPVASATRPVPPNAGTPLMRPVPPGAPPSAAGRTGRLARPRPPTRKSPWRWVWYGAMALSALQYAGPAALHVVGHHHASHAAVVRSAYGPGGYVVQGVDSPASRKQSIVPATQSVALSADVLNCCSLTVTEMAPTADGGVQLRISFTPFPDYPWVPDAPHTGIFLATDSDVGQLLAVNGPAAQPAGGGPIWGWYTFGHLGGDPSTLKLHYLSATVSLPVAGPAK